MTRRWKLDRPSPESRVARLEFQLPHSLCVKIRKELYSEVEGKVPFGALSTLGEELFTRWLRERGVIT